MDARFKYWLLAVLALAAVIGLFAGRAQPQTIAAAPTPVPTAVPAAQPNHINIVPLAQSEVPGQFNPAVLQVHVGQRVTFVNTAGIDHSAVADNLAFNTDILAPGQSKSWTPSKPGRYLYGCYLHPTMRGQIDVSP